MAVLKKWIDRVSGPGWLALACLLVGAFWLRQHDARVRQQVQLQQVRRQTSAEVAALQKQAQQAVKQANVENARAVQKLEARRNALQQENRQLAAQLTELRKQAQNQAGQAATLPIPEIVTRVASQLGLKAQDLAAETSSRQGAKPQKQLQMTNDELRKTAGRTADIAQGAASAAGAEGTPHPAAGAATLSPRRGLPNIAGGRLMARLKPRPPKEALQAAAAKKNATPAQAANGVALALSGTGARKVETALVELDSCRAESAIEIRQVSNCQARAQADEAAIERLDGSVASLNRALAAKDKILRRQAGEYQAELRAARGSFWGRLARVAEHVAAGVAVGVVIGAAVK